MKQDDHSVVVWSLGVTRPKHIIWIPEAKGIWRRSGNISSFFKILYSLMVHAWGVATGAHFKSNEKGRRSNRIRKTCYNPALLHWKYERKREREVRKEVHFALRGFVSWIAKFKYKCPDEPYVQLYVSEDRYGDVNGTVEYHGMPGVAYHFPIYLVPRNSIKLCTIFHFFLSVCLCSLKREDSCPAHICPSGIQTYTTWKRY